MSRSIVRSKINAKYNPVQTGGGGGGSAIAVLDEGSLITSNATSFNFTGGAITASGGAAVTVNVNLLTSITAAGLAALKTSNSLVPGMLYNITDAPILGAPFNLSLSNPFFYIEALDTNRINDCGVLIVSPNLIDSYSIQLWYDLEANNHPKFYDPYTNNTIEGWNNINWFFQSGVNILGYYNTDTWNNTIINNSIVSVYGPIFKFKNNYINNSQLNYTSGFSNPCEVENNILENSTVVVSTPPSYFINNCLKNSSSDIPVTNSFDSNIIEGSRLKLNKGLLGVADFIKNIIKLSEIVLDDLNVSLNLVSENYLEHSTLEVIGKDGEVLSIFKNHIFKSTVRFTLFYFLQDFVRNSISNTLLEITNVLNQPIINNNTIENSFIQLETCNIVKCNIFGMGEDSATPAVLDTSISYVMCNYRRGEDSTFYAEYDFDNPAIFDTVNYIMTFPGSHNQWVGKAIAYSSNGSVGNTKLYSLVNYPTNHKFLFYANDSLVKLDVYTVTGFFIFYKCPCGEGYISDPFPLDTNYNFMLMDGRSSDLGPVVNPGTEVVILDAKAY